MRMHGIYHYAAYSPVAGTNWTLVVDAPNSDFMGAVVVTGIVSVALGILLMAGAVVYSSQVSGRISDSLSLATERLSALAEGYIPVRNNIAFFINNICPSISAYIDIAKNVIQQIIFIAANQIGIV